MRDINVHSERGDSVKTSLTESSGPAIWFLISETFCRSHLNLPG